MASTSNSNEQQEHQQPCSVTDDDYPLLNNQSLEELLRHWADINGLSHDSHQHNHEQFVGAPPSYDPNTALAIVPSESSARSDMVTDVNQNGLINMDEEVMINIEDYLIDTPGDYCDQTSISPLAIWPPTTPPQFLGDSSNCICCQVLREIVHFNGDYTEKLEIHGRIGLISHVVHETKYQLVNGLPLVVEHDKIDSNAPVAIAVVVDQLSQRVPEESGTRLFKSSLAMQRERTGRLKLSDLEAHFHLPIEVAAKKLAICPTVLKKISRKYGMPRWPYRKEQIKSVDRQILSLIVSLRKKNNGEENALVRKKIDMLKQEREQILNGMIAK
ncbi:hypothetical protein Sjap_019730 [Stephania japonica]|uniref:RWP-RK domain-containing protein n=1 Tax=Stephania japonica TaxID=461633 RepID=A0AAP0F0P7_9MAGN